MDEEKIHLDLDRTLIHVDKNRVERIENREEKNTGNNNKENGNKKADMIEIWEDVVSLKELIISLVLCIFTSFVGYYLAPAKEPWPLLLGLLGAILGFIISSIVVKPKRILTQESEE